MIEVEIWSDFLCPFCYIGKTQFDKALEQFKNKDQVKVIYKSFELDTEAVKSQSISINKMLAEKYGQSEAWAEQMNDQLTEHAKEYGLEFNMKLVKPTNSFDSHRLSRMSEAHGVQTQVMNDLFEAYFTRGEDVANHEVLKKIAFKNGIAAEEVDKLFSTDIAADEVRADEEEAGELDITGVPFFIFNRKFALSGAQPAEVFLESLEELAE
ncbi:MAG: DsbA family oxidoreductase [Pseudobdellovibrio sp.]